MTIISAPSFQKGDRAYIISPSAGLMPFVAKRVQRAKSHLESLGYEVIMSETAMQNNGYISADANARVKDIHTAFSDKKCSLVLCAIGGNHSNQLLPLLDYELIRDNPKAFCGYSDITVLHCAFLAKSGLQTFYGPTFLNQFGEHPDVLDFTKKNFKNTLMNGVQPAEISSKSYTDEILDWFANADVTRPRKLLNHKGLQVWKSGTATGYAFPFTIPSINHVINTEYMPHIKNQILMIDIPEGASMHEGLSVGEFDAWFSDLVNAGLLKDVAGIVFGRAYKYTPDMVNELKRVVLNHCHTYKFPVLYGADFGHTDPMLTIPYMSAWEINTNENNSLKFVKSA